MAISVVQSVHVTDFSSGTAVASLSATTNGNWIAIALSISANRTLSSVTDSNSTSYSTAFNVTSAFNGELKAHGRYAKPAASITSVSITINSGTGGTSIQATVYEIATADASAPLDPTPVTNDQSGQTVFTTGDITPALADSLLIAAWAGSFDDPQTVTPDTAFTNTGSGPQNRLGSLVVAATTPVDYDVTTTAAVDACSGIMAFKGASGGTSIPIAQGTPTIAGTALRMGFTINMPDEDA